MKTIVWIVVICLLYILQCALIPLVTLNGIKPDLLLITVLSTGLLVGKEKGVAVGFFAGLLADLASGGVFGSHTLSKMAIGYGAGMLERKVFKENILLPLLAVMVATVIHSVLMTGILVFLGFRVEIISLVMHNLLPLLAYNVIVAVPIHLIIYKINYAEMYRTE
ncbi:rod shape-determining protein MreD [Sporomusaceae bacterium BoRhaA]|uniref:rod shape-determining protein MreD n=1 Tax=Pelorhabdus rhamnosifermentans TaxID=2772457 RepID=UPI001C062678|nr:rod shape-determining protein MreD [Pelorhabdus rhamnosifermentans]MBU2699781.1 rod shape-determining protein MreD [Pelorhabdus rhamnosifermentans]